MTVLSLRYFVVGLTMEVGIEPRGIIHWGIISFGC